MSFCVHYNIPSTCGILETALTCYRYNKAIQLSWLSKGITGVMGLIPFVSINLFFFSGQKKKLLTHFKDHSSYSLTKTQKFLQIYKSKIIPLSKSQNFHLISCLVERVMVYKFNRKHCQPHFIFI